MQLTSEETLPPESQWHSPNQSNPSSFSHPTTTTRDPATPQNLPDFGCSLTRIPKTCQTLVNSHKSDTPSIPRSQLTADYNTFRGRELFELPYLHRFQFTLFPAGILNALRHKDLPLSQSSSLGHILKLDVERKPKQSLTAARPRTQPLSTALTSMELQPEVKALAPILKRSRNVWIKASR